MQSSSQVITTNKPTPCFLQAGCPSCRPTNNVRALADHRNSTASLYCLSRFVKDTQRLSSPSWNAPQLFSNILRPGASSTLEIAHYCSIHNVVVNRICITSFASILRKLLVKENRDYRNTGIAVFRVADTRTSLQALSHSRIIRQNNSLFSRHVRICQI